MNNTDLAAMAQTVAKIKKAIERFEQELQQGQARTMLVEQVPISLFDLPLDAALLWSQWTSAQANKRLQ